jgi:hypothetical protein
MNINTLDKTFNAFKVHASCLKTPQMQNGLDNHLMQIKYLLYRSTAVQRKWPCTHKHTAVYSIAGMVNEMPPIMPISHKDQPSNIDPQNASNVFFTVFSTISGDENESSISLCKHTANYLIRHRLDASH